MIRMTVMKNTLGLVDAHCSDWLVRGGAGGAVCVLATSRVWLCGYCRRRVRTNAVARAVTETGGLKIIPVVPSTQGDALWRHVCPMRSN